mgnify:CR=1 FL=1
MLNNARSLGKTNNMGLVAVPGSVPFSTVNVNAYLSVTPTSGTAVAFTSDTAGAAGAAYHVVLTADGLAKASINCVTAGCTKLNTIIQNKTGGTAGNNWTLNVLAHGHTGGGVLITEDNTNKVVTILYETAVSTVTDVETAIGSATYVEVKTTGTGANVLATATDTIYAKAFTGGTAATWVAWTVSTHTLTVHFTNTTTTTTLMKTAVNATHADKFITLSGAVGADTWATGDAFASTHLTTGGGVSAVALDSTEIKGEGFTAARTGVTGDGQVTITFQEPYQWMQSGRCALQLASGANYIAQFGAYNSITKAVVINLRDLAGALVEPVVLTGDAINFCFYMVK